MAETATLPPDAPPSALPEGVVEPPHVMPGETPPPPPGPDDDDGKPLDDVVDEDASQARLRGSRAKSKQAAARINKLAEQNWDLQQRLKALESAQKPVDSGPPKALFSGAPKAPTPAEFAKPAPAPEEFASADDPYGETLLARMRWEQEKRDHEALVAQLQAEVRHITQEQRHAWAEVDTAHQQRMIKAVRQRPEIVPALQQAGQVLQAGSVLDVAIKLDNQSADVAVFLATHPDLLDELVLLTAAQPVTEETVAMTRRLLRREMTAETTGSVAPPIQSVSAPRPPNPVRTGLPRTASAPPDVTGSIDEHARYFAPKR